MYKSSIFSGKTSFFRGDIQYIEKLHQLVQNPDLYGCCTYQGIKIADKLPCVEALQERI